MDTSLKPNEVYVIKSVSQEGLAWGGFQWPLEPGAVISAPDWVPDDQCGHGLHGLLEGVGDWTLVARNGKGLLLAVEKDSIIDLGGKVKFPRCRVLGVFSVYTKAATWLAKNGYKGVHNVVWKSDGVIDAKVGEFSHISTPNRARVGIGSSGTVTVGDYSYVDAESHCKIVTGAYSNVYTGYACAIETGQKCIVEAGSYCAVEAGANSLIKGSHNCHIMAGLGSVVKAQLGSKLRLEYLDENGNSRFYSKRVDDVGLKAGVYYQLDENGEYQEATP